MVKRILTAGLFLFAASALAQPTPFRVPPKYTVATAPSCVDGEPKLYSVTDAASSASCTVGGGSTDVICKCTDGTAAVVAAGSGGSSNSFETISAPAGTAPVADSATDTLNITCAGGLTCTGTAATDTLDFTMGTASLATALAANGANCSAGNYPLGVDASGAAESCTADGPATYAASVSAAGPATTATALAADPADCAANQYANAIAASGALTCAAIADADVPDSITVTLAGTATALAANGANCSAGQYPLGVDASGAVESCTADDDVPDAGEVAVSAIANGTDGELITWGADGVATTVAVGTATHVLTSNGVGAAPTFQAAASGGIGGSTGATDNAILRADGTGGATLQTSPTTIADTSGAITTSSNNDWIIKSGGNAGLKVLTTSFLVLVDNNANTALVGNNGASFGLNLQSTYQFSWSPTSAVNEVADTGLARNAAGVVRVTNGSTGIGALLNAVLVEPNTAVAAGPNVIVANESGTLFTNEGATAANYHTLVTAAAGYKFTFVVADADGLRVTAAAGDVIHIPGDASTAGGYCESTTLWDQLEVVSINATDWAGSPTGAGWTCDGP